MSKPSKRFQKAATAYEAAKVYSLAEGVELVQTLAPTKFKGSVEVHIKLGIDPKKSDQMVRGSIVLPHGTGKTKRILAFVTPEKEKEAREAGADLIGDEEKILNIKQTQKIDFDIAVAIPEMMKKLGPIAKILGQKGLIPNPKTETVTPNLSKVIPELKSGSKISFKNDDGGNLHQVIGKSDFTKEQLMENFQTFIDTIKRLKPESMKGIYLKNIVMCSSMGPAVKVQDK